jgi:hypothetical protein
MTIMLCLSSGVRDDACALRFVDLDTWPCAALQCRVVATAKRLGVQTVAVYSEADRHAPHVAVGGHA